MSGYEIEQTQDEFGEDRFFVTDPAGNWVGDAHPTREAAQAWIDDAEPWDDPRHGSWDVRRVREAGEVVSAATTPRLTKAQQRVLDYLLADESGDFIVVPYSVTRDVRPIDALLELHLIEMEWRPASLPPGSFDACYRAVRS